MSEPLEQGGGIAHYILTDLLTLPQPGENVYAHNITTCPPFPLRFSDLPACLDTFVLRKISPEVVVGEGNLAEFRKPQRNAQHHY